MKKIYFALAVVAAAMLISCEREQSFELSPVGENGIAFVLQNAATRSMGEASSVISGETIPLGTDNMGNALFLEETIEDLNEICPATKGAPAYTVNVGTLYTTMGVYAEGNFGGDITFDVMDESMTDNPNGGKGWRYHYQYSSDPWPQNEDEKVDFYLRMPAQMAGASNFAYANKQIAFDFSPLPTAAEQDDILFSQTSLTKCEHDGYLTRGGAPVMMYHALTGIKFRIGNDNSGTTKTIITKVKFTGLKGLGHCVVTPNANGDKNSDKVAWTLDDNASYSYSQTFTNPNYSTAAGVDGSVNFIKDTNNPQFGDSWYTGSDGNNNPSNLRNLNNEDGTWTFWLIPQAMTSSVKLEVTFCVKTPETSTETGGGLITHTIDFGKALADKSVEWKAGQLRTYTLVPKDVDVEIKDTMSGNVKSNLHVTNTGNVAEYVRMLVLGNWYGWAPGTSAEDMANTEPSILVGYDSDGTDNRDVMVDPWYRGDATYGSYFDDTFKLGVCNGNGWKRGTGGYYFPTPIGPGGEITSSTTPLFQTYTWPDGTPFPTIYLPTNTSNVRQPAVGVHLVMEVVIQAIGTTKPDGTPYADCWEAWTAAVGSTIAEKS